MRVEALEVFSMMQSTTAKARQFNLTQLTPTYSVLVFYRRRADKWI